MTRHVRRRRLRRITHRLRVWLRARRNAADPNEPSDAGSYTTEWIVVTALVVAIALAVLAIWQPKLLHFVNGIQL